MGVADPGLVIGGMGGIRYILMGLWGQEHTNRFFSTRASGDAFSQ